MTLLMISLPWKRLACAVTVAVGLQGCGVAGPDEDFEAEPDALYSHSQQGVISCSTRTDTGYKNGAPFTITVVTVDGKPVELDTANAFSVMQTAAAAAGVNLTVVSGFRTQAEQQYLYNCYANCNCNSCNLAAQPGYSNHQSGHALDLNTSSGGVLTWLNAHGAAYGFNRTVPSEVWHWEWWSGGPGGGACASTPDNCSFAEAQACGGYGCGCVDHHCNGGSCAGSGCSATHASACGGYGCNCADGACGGGFCPGTGCTAKETKDCSFVGCGCVDHACSGGACAGSGSTARNAMDCGAYGCHSVDGKCSGGYCPGTGCTLKQSNDCTAMGCGCADEKCSGGVCAGIGCTARQALDCTASGQGCALGKCVAAPPDGGLTPAEQLARPATVLPPPVVPLTEAPGRPDPERDPNLNGGRAPGPVQGGCSTAPGSLGLFGLGLMLARRRLTSS